jgi:hypothetical protein
MRKSLVWRALWMGALVLLVAVGAALAQEAEQPSSDTPADTPSVANDTVSPPPDAVASPGTDDLSNAISADLYNASNPYTGLPPLGMPAPAQAPSSGLHLGPFYLTGVSDSAYYSTVNSQGGNSTTYWGNNIIAGISLSENVGENGHLSFRAVPQVLFSSGHTWFNEVNNLAYTNQLTDRWTLSATSSLAYFQNSILTNPQYALVNTSAGYVLQTIYTQTTQPAFYQYTNVSASYQLGTKTTLSLTPTAGVSFTNSSGPLTVSYQFGGSAAVSHQYSNKGTVSVYYGFSHSVIPASNTTGPNGWNSSSFGVGISQGLGGETWSLAFNVASSSQATPDLTWSVIGNAALIKKFRDSSSSLFAAYSRSQSALLTQTPGYFDQASVGYNRPFGEKTNVNVGAGWYRSDTNVQTLYVNNAHGVRVNGSVFYQLLPSLSASAGFFLGQQYGAGGNQLYLFNGRSNSFNIGLTWTPGREARSATNPSGVGSSVPIY